MVITVLCLLADFNFTPENKAAGRFFSRNNRNFTGFSIDLKKSADNDVSKTADCIIKGIGSLQYSDVLSVIRWRMHPYVKKFRQIWYAKIKK
jgi:hypothetical protein